LLVATCIAAGLQGCMPFKAVFRGHPDYRDSKRFPTNAIAAGNEVFHFQTTDKDWGKTIKVTDWTTDLPVFSTIQQVVAGHSTLAFLLIRKDTILFEYYAEGSTSKSQFPSYSIAKSFTSALIGIAIQEGFINSVDDPVKNYLPELNFHPYFNQLTLRHLLNQTSGIKYSLTQDAVIYYGRDIWKSVKRIEFDTTPGKIQSYLNINYLLLGMALETATGIAPHTYLEEKLWQPLGMETDAFWSADNKNRKEKTFCCLNATAMDYAKFGRLYLHDGSWEGKQIIEQQWVNQSVSRDTTAGSSFGYNFGWHIGLLEYGDFMANGLYKQHIYINPKKELIIVSLLRKEDKLKAERVNWWYVFRQISDQL